MFSLTPLFIATGSPFSNSRPASPPPPDMASSFSRSSASFSACVFSVSGCDSREAVVEVDVSCDCLEVCCGCDDCEGFVEARRVRGTARFLILDTLEHLMTRCILLSLCKIGGRMTLIESLLRRNVDFLLSQHFTMPRSNFTWQ